MFPPATGKAWQGQGIHWKTNGDLLLLLIRVKANDGGYFQSFLKTECFMKRLSEEFPTLSPGIWTVFLCVNSEISEEEDSWNVYFEGSDLKRGIFLLGYIDYITIWTQGLFKSLLDPHLYCFLIPEHLNNIPHASGRLFKLVWIAIFFVWHLTTNRTSTTRHILIDGRLEHIPFPLHDLITWWTLWQLGRRWLDAESCLWPWCIWYVLTTEFIIILISTRTPWENTSSKATTLVTGSPACLNIEQTCWVAMQPSLIRQDKPKNQMAEEYLECFILHNESKQAKRTEHSSYNVFIKW